MAHDIRTGIEFFFKDKLTPGLKTAGAHVKRFGNGAVSAIKTVDKAFSGLGARIASMGVAMGAGALVKTSIDYEDRMVRIGTSANMTAKETNEMRRALLAIASDIKISNQEMAAYAATLADSSIEYETIQKSARFAAQAMQALNKVISKLQF